MCCYAKLLRLRFLIQYILVTYFSKLLSVRFAAILKRRFSLNCLIQKLELFSLTSAGAAIFS